MPLLKTPLDDLTYQVNGLAMQVHNELKPGHREKLYHTRLFELIQQNGLVVEAEKRIEVFIDETLVGFMYMDIWVEQMLVVECKARNQSLGNAELGQVIAYMAATGSELGMLYNFGQSRLEWKRVLPPTNVQEWHKHLHRIVWTPPSATFPTLESTTPIRFAFNSPRPNSNITPLPTPNSSSITPPSVANIRESAAKSVANPSVVIRESATKSVANSSAPIRESVTKSVANPSAYAASGVSITAGNRAVELMRNSVRATYGPEVLAGIGAFGGLFDASALKGMQAPVLVASTDGVGTKVKVAAQVGRYESIGRDLVNHCINDILVQGARPLFFLDYVASSKLEPEMVAEVVQGLAAACQAAGCALLGGETAEMPGVYQPNEFDVAGTIVGVVERANILPRADVQAGDVLVGLRSSGPHTNGYSLIRKVFENTTLDHELAEALLAPHRSYLPLLTPHLNLVKALAHLTGGGFIENIPRVLPEGVGAVVRRGTWPILPIFSRIQLEGHISSEEMHHVFNMGIGMVAVLAPENVTAFQNALAEESFIIGELVAGERTVTLI